MTNKRVFHRINIVLFILAIACLIYYDGHRWLWLKGVTSAWFVAIGVFNLIYAFKTRAERMLPMYLITLGLFFGMLADILLGINFILGILSFALGHILYLFAFCLISRPCRNDLIFIMPLSALSLFMVTATPFIQISDPILKPMLLGYAVLIGCMFGKAASNFKNNRSKDRLFMLIGSAMFWFSDLMLAIDMFGTGWYLAGPLCCYTYWPGQNILAYSLYHYVNENI